MATAPMARLSVVRPAEHAGRRIDLPAASLIVGRRSPDRITDIDLGALDPNGYVSRQHARMERSAGIWTVVDLDSSNGTSVNGSRVPPGLPVRLRDGDVVRMGQVELRFEEEH